MNKPLEKKSRYRKVGDAYLIEVNVREAARLFDQRDPAPFREKELDERFVEYITTSVREFSIRTPLRLAVTIEQSDGLSSATPSLTADVIREAIRSHFEYQVELHTSNLQQYWRRAQFFFFIGGVVLALCVSTAQSIAIPAVPGLSGIFREGLIIFGWVSIWKPIEVLLFDWYPPYETLRFQRKLATMQIDVEFRTVSR